MCLTFALFGFFLSTIFMHILQFKREKKSVIMRSFHTGRLQMVRMKIMLPLTLDNI